MDLLRPRARSLPQRHAARRLPPDPGLGRPRSARRFRAYTSNVDGHFQAAGFPADRVVECHGSIHTVQCAQPCSGALWPRPCQNAQPLELTKRFLGASRVFR
ncbi:Sir2 family NAD-dependent protein deacetylase, partial [Caballeronia calidae]|uniref:Sir2 family NAD-dependent protein deacetylase n=1 Tax=Caballeronia calidae TaxID=1777139 RepID=UPI002FC9B0EB